MSDDLVRWTRATARAVGIVSVFGFFWWRIDQGVPANGELGHWEVLVQFVLLGGVVVGNFLSWRWEMLGATVMAVFGLSLTVVVANDHDPTTTIPLALLFFASPFLHWLAWQRHHAVWKIAVLGVALFAMLAASTVFSVETFESFYGPTHPDTELVALPPSATTWVWSGAVTTTTAEVRAQLAAPGTARLVVSTDDAFTDRVATVAGVDAGTVAMTGEPSTVRVFDVDGLDPDTTYHYAVEVDGSLDTVRTGRFRTFPDGPASFTMAFGSCARLGSDAAVFDQIRAQDPLFYLNLGDWYYADIGEDDRARFREVYDETLTRPAQAGLYRAVSTVYVWDDHDYGPNDADATSDARPAAQMVYREYVPHHPLAAGDGERPIYQSFAVGRVLFVLLDGRSARSPDSVPDTAAKTMLGDEQQAWLEQQLLRGRDDYALTVVTTNVPWIAEPEVGADHWGGFATERAEIADFIAANDVDNVLLLAGDAHMVAIDDGTHSDYSAEGDAGFPVFHASALDRPGSFKGGPYSEGAYPGFGQFGLVHVDDDGTTLRVSLQGLDWEGDQIVAYEFTAPVQQDQR
ncbi:MAG: alkaline phosphatase D family protein [Acidimicrobiales bacterium]|nr:alkaline phosphatase D family protein [Acidimicrobiales bacterium]